MPLLIIINNNAVGDADVGEEQEEQYSPGEHTRGVAAGMGICRGDVAQARPLRTAERTDAR